MIEEDGVPKTRDHPFTDTWAAMEKIFLNSNKVRAIGVSNFSVKKYALTYLDISLWMLTIRASCSLEILLKTAKVVPAVNQVE